MKAIVLGATGAVGLDLVEMLLKDDAFSEVEVFVRRAMPMGNAGHHFKGCRLKRKAIRN